MFSKKKDTAVQEKRPMFGKNESDKTPYIEPVYIFEIHYKTELQIVFRDNNLLCSEFKCMVTSDTELHEDPVQKFIDDAYKKGHMKTIDKSNQYVTNIATQDIKKILYKPTFTMEKRKT